MWYYSLDFTTNSMRESESVYVVTKSIDTQNTNRIECLQRKNSIQKRTIPERLSTFFLACALNCDKSSFDSFSNRRDMVFSEKEIKSLTFFYHLSFIIIMHKFVCNIRFERTLLHSVASFLFNVCAHNWMPFAFISSYFHRVQ